MENKTSEKKQKKKVIIVVIVIILLIALLLLLMMLRKKECIVTFDSNDGREVISVKVKENEKVEKPDDPIREGYTFVGWYYNDELYDFEMPVKEDITLKAEWLEGEAVDISGIVLNVEELSIAPEGTAVLVATLQPENAKIVKLIWSSSDESIATVDENGNIKGIKEGEVTITVATEDGKYTAECRVKVTKDNVAVGSVTISGPREVTAGNTIKLTATVKPDNATNKSVTWRSSNSNIARVDQYGNVRGVRAGTVTITVTTVDGGRTATYRVTVKAGSNNNSASNAPSNPSTPNKPNTPSNPSSPNTPNNPSKPSETKVTGVKITGGNSVNVRSTLQLTATVSPSNATNKKVTWSSSDTNIATVDQNGKVTGKAEGDVTITVTTADGGHTATHKITVNSVYVITFKANVNELGATFDYTVSVTKDGVTFSDYLTITYNGTTKPFKQNYQGNVDKSVKTATINLSNGKKVTATVQYI